MSLFTFLDCIWGLLLIQTFLKNRDPTLMCFQNFQTLIGTFFREKKSPPPFWTFSQISALIRSKSSSMTLYCHMSHVTYKSSQEWQVKSDKSKWQCKRYKSRVTSWVWQVESKKKSGINFALKCFNKMFMRKNLFCDISALICKFYGRNSSKYYYRIP